MISTKSCPVLLALSALLTTIAFADKPSVPQLAPFSKYTQTLVPASDYTDFSYLAFPAIVRVGDEVLVSYKRGQSHALDPGATLDLIRINAATEHVSKPVTIAFLSDQIMQMGEWVRFANGDLANYIDVQYKSGKGNPRAGLHVVRSTDGGKTFGPPERVGAIDGVEYGYAFEDVTEGNTTWMLVMTFSNLAGGKSVFAGRPSAGSVDVIRTDDHGKTWKFVASLTHELGDLPINESSFLRHGDGFLVTVRTYDSHEWLALTDTNFKVRQKVDLNANYPFIKSHIGRPRLFSRDGGWYLMGRNSMGVVETAGIVGAAKQGEPAPSRDRMRLSLFRIEPASLAITRHVVLDNLAGEHVSDGYYAEPYWQQRGDRTCLNVVTYKLSSRRKPDIIRLEFDWEEVR